MKAITKKKILAIAIVAGIVISIVGIITLLSAPKNITAEKIADLRNVCYGNKIENASAYTDSGSAVIAAFYEEPYTNDNPWMTFSSATAPNLAQSRDFTKTTVVACFDHQPFAGKEIARCEKDIKLMSATYKTVFYEAKTGKKIAEGKDIVTNDTTCPSSFVYGSVSNETAREPETKSMSEEIRNFVK